MYYEYSKIREGALNQGDIAISNNRYQDVFVNGKWQNPYEEKQIFAVASPIDNIHGTKIDLMLPEELWLTNKARNVLKIEVDPGDGQGYREVVFGQKVSINYHFIQPKKVIEQFFLK